MPNCVVLLVLFFCVGSFAFDTCGLEKPQVHRFPDFEDIWDLVVSNDFDNFRLAFNACKDSTSNVTIIESGVELVYLTDKIANSNFFSVRDPDEEFEWNDYDNESHSDFQTNLRFIEVFYNFLFKHFTVHSEHCEKIPGIFTHALKELLILENVDDLSSLYELIMYDDFYPEIFSTYAGGDKYDDWKISSYM